MICARDYDFEISKIGYCPLRESICWIKCHWNEGIDESDQKQKKLLENFKKGLTNKK